MRAGLLQLDTSAYRWLSQLQHKSSLTQFSRCVSHTGDGYLYIAIALLVYFTQPVAYMAFVKVGLLGFVIELPCFMLLKAAIKRDRPFVQLPNCPVVIQPSDKFSMPSGHTAAAFLMAGLVAYFYSEYALLAYFWASLIAMSRIILGVHYPSDVLAGAALGSSSVFLALALIL